MIPAGLLTVGPREFGTESGTPRNGLPIMKNRHRATLVWLVTFGLVAPVSAQEDATCRACHVQSETQRRLHAQAEIQQGLEERLIVDSAAVDGSVHGRVGMTCVTCHQGFEGFPHPSEPIVVECEGCHSSVGQMYETSVHGYALARGNPRAPDCVRCHGDHGVLPSSDPRSKTHKVRLPTTCAECHGSAGLLTEQLVKLPQSFAAYAQSVHGEGTSRGVAAAASCADCHAVHELKGAADPESRINHRNVASTCGQCHPDVQLAYDESIHGRALEAGVTDSPTCTDCHGEHLILSPRNREAKTNPVRLATETCGECHDDPIIVAKYNMQSGVVGSYTDSYHGWASRRESAEAASCVDCHTAHSVLPKADSASTVHVSNVVTTCQKCHENADANFAASYDHISASIATNPVNRWIRRIYIVAIILIIGVMLLHNVIIMNYFMMRRRKEEENSSRMILRLDRTQVAQHLLLTISFVMLVITGFALRFPEAWWVEMLTAAGLSESLRGNLHRVFAVLLIGVSISHVYYVFATRRGREEFKAIMPVWKDARDLWTNLKFYTWRSPRAAKFGRYDYSQKAEYWALIWGTIVMILTGFVLWFPEYAVKVFPAIIVTASQTIHYYEAWLATLAIVVWHFFFVIFHPEEYPMSWTWLTGRMSEKSVRKHHAAWYEEIKGKGLPESGTKESQDEESEEEPALVRGGDATRH